MSRESDTAERATDGPSENTDSSADQQRFDSQLLSDLFVNVVPIAIIAAFVLMFGLLSPAGGDPLLLFHGALIGGVVLVSIVAGWVISNEDGELEGSAGSSHNGESEP